jgi:Fe-S oxidoreductase
MADITEMTRLCSVCYKMCRDMCSVAGATRHEADSPHNRAFIAYEVMHGKIELTPEIVEYFYRCSLCKACREACEPGHDAGEVLYAARRELDDELLPETLRSVKERISSPKPYGDEPEAVRELIARSRSEGAPLLLFGQKMRAGSADGIEQIKAARSLMKKLETPFTVLEDEPATGQIPYFLGFTGAGKQRAEECVKQIRSENAEKVVVFSADDFRMFKVGYPALGIETGNIEVLSLPEFLLTLIRERKPRFKDTGTIAVTYHDSCGLGREGRIFEQPREIIRMIPGVQLVELALTRDQAPCCGYGVGLSFTHPAITRAMAQRLAEFGKNTGADIMVTGCPTCRDTILENVDDQSTVPEILDIILFLDRMIP